MLWLWPCGDMGDPQVGCFHLVSVEPGLFNAQAGKGKVKEAAWEDPAGRLRGKGWGKVCGSGRGAGSWVPALPRRGSGLCPTLPALGGRRERTLCCA